VSPALTVAAKAISFCSAGYSFGSRSKKGEYDFAIPAPANWLGRISGFSSLNPTLYTIVHIGRAMNNLF
jgi:hypothetical protein